jgi:sterol desaturase/sphingolipid hydroxylase (fatty acid hydroxylase superfamily)
MMMMRMKEAADLLWGYLPVSLQEHFDSSEDMAMRVAQAYWSGLELGAATLLFTVVMELLSWQTVHKLCTEQKGGRRLYIWAVLANLFNHLVLGAPTYTLAVILFCRHVFEYRTRMDWCTSIVRGVCVLLSHNTIYYLVHHFFHTAGPYWYRFHKPHHKFHNFVPPMSANAVSLVEYMLAYVLPFAVGAAIFHPSSAELYWSVAYVSFCNILVHTPWLEALSRKVEPMWVSTRGHLEHHRRLTVHYAAPTVNLDWYVDQWAKLTKKH